MSVERNGREIELACDDCSTESFRPFASDEFREMMAAAHDAGWRTFKRGGAWHNACPSCSQDWVDGMKQGKLL